MSNKRCNVCANPMEVWGYSRIDEHTIFKCPKCGNKEVVKDADIPLPKHKQSLFERITASPEVLAPEFVYHVTSFLDGLDKPKKIWYSTLINNQYFNTELEAKRATVAKLKESCDE